MCARIFSRSFPQETLQFRNKAVHLFVGADGYPKVIIYAGLAEVADIYPPLPQIAEYLLCSALRMRRKQEVRGAVRDDEAQFPQTLCGALSCGDYLPADLTQYDEGINNYGRDAVRQYTAGELDRDGAIAAFKTNVADSFDVEVDF